MNAGCVDQNDLAFGLGDHTLNLETRGLRLVGNGGNLLADQLIQQCRLAGIWSADEGDVAASVAISFFELLLRLGFAFSAKICTRLIKVSVVFSKPRRELNSSLP